MLKKINRIHLKKQYDSVFHSGRKYVSRHIVVYIMKNAVCLNRYGIIASKKVGRANIRNLAKRRMRHIMQATKARTKPGYDFTIICRGNIKTAGYGDLLQEFMNILKKADLYVEEIGN